MTEVNCGKVDVLVINNNNYEVIISKAGLVDVFEVALGEVVFKTAHQNINVRELQGN